MKLIFCRECRDIVKLTYENRSCLCGKSSGHYMRDGRTANISGDAVAIGIDNSSFYKAVGDKQEIKIGKVFGAFVIPVLNCHERQNPNDYHTDQRIIIEA